MESRPLHWAILLWSIVYLTSLLKQKPDGIRCSLRLNEEVLGLWYVPLGVFFKLYKSSSTNVDDQPRYPLRFKMFRVLIAALLVIPALAKNNFAGITVSNSIGGTGTYTCRTQAQVRLSPILEKLHIESFFPSGIK